MPGLHVIIGEDDFLVSNAAAKVVGDGIGLEVVDSGNSGNEDAQLADIRRAEESLLTPPFLEPKKVTWWKNVRFLPGGGRGKGDDEGGGRVSEAVKGALDKFVRKLVEISLPDNQHFILTAPKLLQTSVIAKTLKKSAEMIVFETPKNAMAAAQSALPRAVEMAGEMGLSFEGGAVDAFVARVGADTRSLMSELAKMRDYLGGATKITEADVEAVTSTGVGVEPEIWSVTDAAGARNLAKALEAVSRFEGEESFAIVMTTVLEKCFRQLAELKDAQERGKLQDAVRGMNRWAAEKMTRNLGLWQLRELRVARKRFLDLRERSVSGATCAGDELVVELVRALGGPRGRGGAR